MDLAGNVWVMSERCDDERVILKLTDAITELVSVVALLAGKLSREDKKILDALLVRSDRVARKLEALDAKTPPTS